MGEYLGIWRFHLRPDADRAAFERLIGQLGDYFAQVPGVRAYTLHRPDPAGPAIADDYVTIERWESPDVHARAIRELRRRGDERDFGDAKDAQAFEAYAATRGMCDRATYESYLAVV
jgi:quinol monooxygenase YgiN